MVDKLPSLSGTTSAADTVSDILPQARDALETVLDDFRLDEQRPPASLEEGLGLDYDRTRYRDPQIMFVDVDIDSAAVEASTPAV